MRPFRLLDSQKHFTWYPRARAVDPGSMYLDLGEEGGMVNSSRNVLSIYMEGSRRDEILQSMQEGLTRGNQPQRWGNAGKEYTIKSTGCGRSLTCSLLNT